MHTAKCPAVRLHLSPTLFSAPFRLVQERGVRSSSRLSVRGGQYSYVTRGGAERGYGLSASRARYLCKLTAPAFSRVYNAADKGRPRHPSPLPRSRIGLDVAVTSAPPRSECLPDALGLGSSPRGSVFVVALIRKSVTSNLCDVCYNAYGERLNFGRR